MKIITDIKVLETNESTYELERHTYLGNETYIQFEGEVVPVNVVKELIRGRRFIDPKRGVDIVLGCSQEVGDILQLQYDAFENMSQNIDTLLRHKDILSRQNVDLRKRFVKVLKAGFFTRLKYLFTGIKEPK